MNVNDASQTETEAIPGDSGRVNLSDEWNIAQLWLCQNTKLCPTDRKFYQLIPPELCSEKNKREFYVFGGQAIKETKVR